MFCKKETVVAIALSGLFALLTTQCLCSPETDLNSINGINAPSQRAEMIPTTINTVPCSTSDNELIATHTLLAEQALSQGNPAEYTRLSMSPIPGLSYGCKEEQTRRNPVLAQCSQSERQLVLQQFTKAFNALNVNDIVRSIERIENVAKSVSKSCWIAVNYPQNAQVQQACSSKELDFVVSVFTQSIHITKQLLANPGDMRSLQSLLNLQEQMASALTPGCLSVITSFQKQQTSANNSFSMTGGTGNVIDHGNGTLSMPGVGACTPSGCMAF